MEWAFSAYEACVASAFAIPRGRTDPTPVAAARRAHRGEEAEPSDGHHRLPPLGAIEPHLTKTSNNSKKPTDLDPTFITKQLATIDKTLRSDNSFIGLVGPNDTGKTLTLQYYASKSRKNSIYCTINPNTYKSLSDSLYQRMYEPLFKLPGILGDIRFGDSRKDPPQVIIERVFRKAALTEKVQVFIDIHDRQGKPQPRHQFDAEHFIHDVKYLVKSVQWVRCMFASVDEFSFDEVDKRESRLVLIRLNNLSANHARHFLNNQCTCKTCGAATFNDGKHNFIDVLRIAESC